MRLEKKITSGIAH